MQAEYWGEVMTSVLSKMNINFLFNISLEVRSLSNETSHGDYDEATSTVEVLHVSAE